MQGAKVPTPPLENRRDENGHSRERFGTSAKNELADIVTSEEYCNSYRHRDGRSSLGSDAR